MSPKIFLLHLLLLNDAKSKPSPDHAFFGSKGVETLGMFKVFKGFMEMTGVADLVRDLQLTVAANRGGVAAGIEGLALGTGVTETSPYLPKGKNQNRVENHRRWAVRRERRLGWNECTGRGPRSSRVCPRGLLGARNCRQHLRSMACLRRSIADYT